MEATRLFIGKSTDAVSSGNNVIDYDVDQKHLLLVDRILHN